MLRWGASPAANEAPPEWAQKIIHARLVIGEAVILGSDPLPAAYVSPRGFSLLLTLEDRTKTDELFAALAQDGTVAMPVQQTFWSERFGVVIDQFGVQWDITCG
jgi:PhnB protein